MKRFPLPDPGEGLTEAEIVTWLVAVGDEVKVNDPIVEIETSKSLVELPSPWAGRVVELLSQPGEVVEVGTEIIVIDDGEADSDEGSGPSAGAGAGAGAAEPAAPETSAAEGATPEALAPAPATDAAGAEAPAAASSYLVGYGPEAAATARRPRKPGAAMAKPPVRKYARDRGVRLREVPGTGPGGTVTYADVDAWLAGAGRPVDQGTRTEPPVPPVAEVSGSEHEEYLAGPPKLSYGRVPVRGIRKATAAAVTKSLFTAPHVTEWLTCDVTATMDLVERLKDAREFRDVRVSPMLMVAKAACLALRTNPELNARWDEAAQEIVYYGDVNLGVAAATPRGLLVPNIKGADQMGLLELARHFGELTRTARDGRTTPAELRGGTFTITNVGVFGVDAGTPILNNGESGILCLGAISRRPWVVGHGSEERIEPRWVTTLAVSFDHRLVDGEGGSKFLADVARLLADPALALLF
ncbi:dihydrolipoamide acetyltransferase family protein [Raineyella fluvialis]|uniref:Dihydrolipoamide acetyltransferase component of pyruvate dehydrogenase complex n=1 Tax=Raineyella fluvialis TaxID=2662261 RepID=A0A5Q2FB02_9ACTN|nr:dihydrolipoamide acetyltransferase family protein [Raineyella fluvialis]QGF23571.1 2-oxo acid dehydrogenase subunit E2 [Raineyella fluvialis]